MAKENIEVLSTEKRTFPPSKEFSQKAHIKSMKEYEQLYKRSVDDPEKFWGEMPTWGMYQGEPPNIDLVIVPAIDGNFDPAANQLIPFEAQFQFLHSLQNYFLTNELLAPGHVIPMLDNDELRRRRAGFVATFCERPFYFIRAATPQVLLDRVDQILA